MFEAKKSRLFSTSSSDSNVATKNSFLSAAQQKTATVKSENGAIKYSTTGNDFVDQFGQLGTMKSPRSYSDISRDVSTLYGKNPRLTVCLIFFIRMITRVVSLFDGTKTKSVQRGSGLRHEGIVRMIWLSINHKNVFWNNIQLYISAGSWKDIIQMLSYDLQYNGWKDRQLDWNNFGKLLLAGLENENSTNLVKKYLPQIKANSKCNTVEAQADNLIAKWICSLLFGGKTQEDNYKNYRTYRKLKTSGTAHQWQQLISQGKHNLVDFDTVHGRALALMVSGKYLANNKLEAKYEKWIESRPVAKFTGYPHELFTKISQKKYQIDTLNSQFRGLVETAKKGANQNTSLIVVRDTSGSMISPATGTTQSCFGIAKALALFFSEMLPKGAFANAWIEFNSSAKLHFWKGSTPYEKWVNDSSHYVGSTEFLSVIQLLCSIKSKGISESEFPTGILCISDNEFNPGQLNKTNVESALQLLKHAGFSKEYVANFQIVLWNLQRRGAGNKFETYGDVKNIFYFSGYDGSTVAFLTGTEEQAEKKAPSTAAELFEAAMDQEIMHLIKM